MSAEIPTLGQINKYLKPKKPNIWLAKPNKQIITKLSEARNITQTLNFGGIHEISFTLPFTVTKDHKEVRNAHVDMIRGHFLLKVDNEWYVLNQPNRSASEGQEVLEIRAYLLPYMLRNKMIRAYEGVKRPSEVLSDILADTNWSVGYIDATFELKYRHFEIPEATALDCINQIAETFGGVVVYNTDRQTVNLYRLDLLGVDKGLSIKYGKYLKAIREEPNFDEVCTRLYLYGKDDLTIRGVNPTGTAYIEDLSYYMHPYSETIINEEQDIYVVNSHSYYMSDELCHALLKYKKLLDEKSDEFSNLLTQQNALLAELTDLEDEKYHLETALQIILDNLDTWNATHSGQVNHELIQQRDAKQAEINAKQAEIALKNQEIAAVLSQIDALKQAIAIEKHFTPELLAERANFIFERKWENPYIDDPKELLARGKEEIVKMSQPQLAYTIDIVDFLKVVECQRDWDKLTLGDVVTVKYPNFGIDIKAKIVTINHDHENNSISLEIANTKDIKSGFLTLKDVVKNQISTSTMIDMYKHKWDLGEEAQGIIGEFINNAIDANKQAIKAGVNETYVFDRRGITLKDPNDPNNFMRALHNVLAFTNDGGNSFKHAITPEGIVAEYLIGKVILGQHLTIGDANGILDIVGNLISIKDDKGNVRTLLGNYATDKYGLLLKDKTGNTTILDEDGILQTWQEGRADNVDSSHPLVLNIYLPPETKGIHKALLRFRRMQFRAYSTGASSGGSVSTTSASGGGATVTSASGGGTTATSWGAIWSMGGGSLPGDFMSLSGEHNHGVPSGTSLVTSGGGSVTFVSSGRHAHSVQVAHTHDVNVPNHTHTVNVPSHSHYFSLPSHSHGIIYGIYHGSTASGIGIKVNGVDVTANLGGPFSSDQTNLNIAPYLTIGGWNTIELSASGLGRIDATVFIQAKMGV